MYVIPDKTKIRNKRKEAGFSMNELSIQAGLSSAAIFRLESGQTQKTSDLRLQQIAKILKCPVEDLMAKEESCRSGKEF